METFLVYMLKCAVCVAVYSLFYRVLFSRETFHRTNRIVLLCVMALSCIIPLAGGLLRSAAESSGVALPSDTVLTVWLDGATASGAAPLHTPWWLVAAVAVYLAGVLAVAVRTVLSVVSIHRLMRRGRRQILPDGIRLVLHDAGEAPFSWMHTVVMSQKDWQENGPCILAHERAHISLHHSADMVAAELFVCLQWFNPAAWLLRRELQDIHEFEADRAVLAQGMDAREYQMLLIRKAVGSRLYSLANSLNHSSLKKRITMMIKKKSNPWARAKLLYLLPLTAAVAGFMACTDTAADGNMAGSKDTDKIVIDKGMAAPASAQSLPGDTVMSFVEKMPEFPGGMDAMMKFLKENVKYPDAAKASEAEGRVVVQFVVDKEGNVTEPSVVKSAGEVLDAEALRVVGMMPRWTPGMNDGKPVRVKYVMPFTFKMP